MKAVLSQRMGIEEAMNVYRQIRQEDALVQFAQLMWDSDAHIARNAAWVMTQSTDEEVAWLVPLQNRLIDLALATDNVSLRRLTLNLLERMNFDEANLRTDFLDFCIDHMTSTDEPPGVQALCMKLAYKQCRLYPELKDELVRILRSFDTDYFLPATRCVRRRILNDSLASRQGKSKKHK